MSIIERYITHDVAQDALASAKMAFLSGPRQVGKSTLARRLLLNRTNEFSWDDEEFRKSWIKSPATAVAGREEGPILLDEIHKDPRWKQKLKGLYDVTRGEIPIIVTGSARLDVFRKGGDSLLGRYLPYRVHPFSVGEVDVPCAPDQILQRPVVKFPIEDLLRLGSFPEPLIGGSEAKAKRWSRLRKERLISEDVRDLRNISNLRQLQLLVEILPSRVGSLLSVNNLRHDLGVAHDTVKAWIDTLSGVYLCFRIRPWSRKISRAVRAEPKLYFFDLLAVPAGGPRLENLIALHLLKACHYWTDTAQGEFDLHFVRNRDGQEVDFLVSRDGNPWMLVESKSQQTQPSKALVNFAAKLNTPINVQLVHKQGVHKNLPAYGVSVISAETFLAGLV